MPPAPSLQRSTLHPDVQRIHRSAGPGGAHLLALQELLTACHWPDDQLLTHLAGGFPMAGDLPVAHLWEPGESKQATTSLAALLAGVGRCGSQLSTLSAQEFYHPEWEVVQHLVSRLGPQLEQMYLIAADGAGIHLRFPVARPLPLLLGRPASA